MKKPPTSSVEKFAEWCRDAVPDGVFVAVTANIYAKRLDHGGMWNETAYRVCVMRGAHQESHQHHRLDVLGEWLIRIGIPRLFPDQVAYQVRTASPVTKRTKALTPPVAKALPAPKPRALPAPVRGLLTQSAGPITWE